MDPSNRVPHGPFTNMNRFGSMHPYIISSQNKQPKPGGINLGLKPQPTTVKDCVKTKHKISTIQSQIFGTKFHGLSWPPINSPYHFMAFRLKVNRVGKSLTLWSLSKLQVFWCPHVDHAVCTNFSTQTVELRPSERHEILHFSFFFSHFLPFLRILIFFPLRILFFFASFFLFFSHHFFSSFSLSHFFLLIFSFLLAFSPLFGSSWTGWSREEASSPFPHATCVVLNFPSFFLISLFPFIASSIMWLIVSHTFKRTTWLLPCVTLLGFHVASS